MKRKFHSIPKSVFISFISRNGETNSESDDISMNIDCTSTPKKLNSLLNQLHQNAATENHDQRMYAFYVNDTEVTHTLEDALQQVLNVAEDSGGLSLEDTISIEYQPISTLKVRPMTRCVDTLPGHASPVLHVSFSPDGKKIASGGGDMALRFWNAYTHLPLNVCTGHRDHILATCWSPCGKHFVSGDRSGSIRLWDPDTGKQILNELSGHSKWITSFSFEPIHTFGYIIRFASSSKDKLVRIWNIVSGKCENILSGHTDSVEAVIWGGSNLLYTCSRDRTVKVWKVDGDHGRRSTVVLLRTLTGHAHRINTLTINCEHVLRVGAFFSFQQSNKPVDDMPSMSNATSEKTIKVDSTEQQKQSTTTPSPTTTVSDTVNDGINMSGDQGSKKAKKEEDSDVDSQISEYSTIKDKALQAYKYVVIDLENGERIVSGSDDFTLFIWAPQTSNSPLMRLTGHQQMINHVMFSPDGRYFASASFDKKLKLWDTKSGKFLKTFHGHVQSIYRITWSPDSSYVVTASKDSTVKVWSVRSDSASCLHTLSGHADEVYTLDWSPNGSNLVSGSRDHTIKIWHH